VYILRIPTDETVYPLPDYYPVVTQGWVDVSNDVPKFKRWLMKNLALVNYVVYIADWYWPRRFPDWKRLLNSGKPEDREQIKQWRKDTIDAIEEIIVGTENAGKLLVSDVLVTDTSIAGRVRDPDLLKAIRIEPIQNFKFEGKFLEDSQEADNRILAAVGVDPSTFGTAPGTQRQGGSDKRESHNISQVMTTEAEEILLEIPRLIRDFNKYDPAMEFYIKRSVLQTQDQITPADRQTAPA
jgi:hypothetical protein